MPECHLHWTQLCQTSGLLTTVNSQRTQCRSLRFHFMDLQKHYKHTIKLPIQSSLDQTHALHSAQDKWLLVVTSCTLAMIPHLHSVLLLGMDQSPFYCCPDLQDNLLNLGGHPQNHPLLLG